MPFSDQDSKITHNKIGRNEPCFCGSGKKFKKCCLGKEQIPPAKTGRKSNIQEKSIPKQLDDRISYIIEDLNKNHKKRWGRIKENEFFSLVDSVYSDRRYNKYRFTLTEMEEIVKKYGQPPNDKDKDGLKKMRKFCFNAVKDKYTEEDITRLIIDHYMQMIDCYDKKQYRESHIIGSCAEELIEYLETSSEVPLFFYEKVMEGIMMHQEAKIKEGEQVLKEIGLDLDALKDKESSLIDKMGTISLTVEQEKKMAEYFERNPDFKKEQEEMIDTNLKKMGEMIIAGELNELLLDPEEISMVGAEILELLKTKLPKEKIEATPEDQIEDTVSKLLLDVAGKWVPQIFDDSRWAYIAEIIKSKIEAMEEGEQKNKQQVLLTALMFLNNNDDWVKEYLGQMIIAGSILVLRDS